MAVMVCEHWESILSGGEGNGKGIYVDGAGGGKGLVHTFYREKLLDIA